MEQKRKIVQINTDFDELDGARCIVVLCDDGTIWESSNLGRPVGEWIKVPIDRVVDGE